MPTAHDYRTAAARLRQLSQQVDDHVAALRGGPVTDVFTGPIADRVAEAIESAVTQMRRAIDGLADMVNRCERRAEICAEYTRQWDAWHDAPYDGTNPVDPPSKPFKWVDRW